MESLSYYKYKSESIRDKILFIQANKCALCERIFVKEFPINKDDYTELQFYKKRKQMRKVYVTINKAYLDHNHKTGIIRGVLCAGCNSIIGEIENNMKLDSEQYIHSQNLSEESLKLIKKKWRNYIEQGLDIGGLDDNIYDIRVRFHDKTH